MDILVYSGFSKRRNSTKLPTGGTTISVVLKDGASLENPIFILTVSSSGSIPTYTYVQAMSHCYFVTDIVMVTNFIYEIHCEQDVLATYRGDILNYNGFVERSAQVKNDLVDDPAINQRETRTFLYKNTAITGFDVSGNYVVRVVGKNGLKSYVATKDQLDTLFDFMYSDSLWDTFTDQLAITTFNPLAYVIGVWWYPLSYLTLSSSTTEVVYLGKYNTGIDLPVVKESIILSGEIARPDRTFNDARDYSERWTKCNLYLPAVGLIQLAATALFETLSYRLEIDTNTGTCSWKILKSNNDELIQLAFVNESVCDGKIAATVQVAQVSQNITDMAAGAVSIGLGAANIVAGNYAQGIQQAVGGISQTLTSALQPSVAINGSAGERGIMQNNTVITISVTRVVPEDFAYNEMGYATYKYMTLSELSGYVKMQNASLSLDGFASDRDAVNSFLNGGFYIE